MCFPELSIIIPTLNEAEGLPLLFSDLLLQQEINFEVIVTDGGSADATCTMAGELFAAQQITGRCVRGPKGRGRQLNAGVSVAKAEWLLFLHADSRLNDGLQLRRAVDFMQQHLKRQPQSVIAGRFVLEFDKQGIADGFGLFFYEAKARLGRPGCIHGDQGMLISKASMLDLGPFRQDLPVMEDTCFAEAVRACGQWLLLPGVITTSARRFQVEGLKTRQTLNALMMNFLAIGWLDFFARAENLYRQQDRTQPLQLLAFFQLIRDLLANMPRRQRWGIWYATGSYVRSQAWQLGFALDCRKAYRRGEDQDLQKTPWLNGFERWFEPLTNHCPGRTLTALLVRLWFARQLGFR